MPWYDSKSKNIWENRTLNFFIYIKKLYWKLFVRYSVKILLSIKGVQNPVNVTKGWHSM